MKHTGLVLLLLLTFSPQSVLPSASALNPQSPARNSVFTMTPYDPRRLGYEALPVIVVGAGGGRLGRGEKLKIFASVLKNQTPREVRAVSFCYCVFQAGNMDDAIEVGKLKIVPVKLSPSQQRRVDIHVINADEIPSLAYKEGAKFHLEIGVCEVQFETGTIWQETGWPGKINPKAP